MKPMSEDASTAKCDHKFIDSNRCLKCGWSPERLVKRERGDFIRVNKLAPLTLLALQKLATDAEWPEVRNFMEPEQVLLLIERLKACCDDWNVFPHGKWATIQRLQEIWNEDFWA